jgi:PTH1 family peptidyl-tRNA hydrolase
MNKLAGAPAPEAKKKVEASVSKPASTGKSHIHQARTNKPVMPTSGPMADMLKKLFGGKGD